MQHVAAKVLLGLSVLWTFSGCGVFQKGTKPEAEQPAAETTSAAAPKETAPFFHTVRWAGESLSLIAKWYTGSVKNWKPIARANPKLNPNVIKIGDRIVIPDKVLKTRKPMPQDFVPTSSKKKKTEPAKSEEQAKERESTEIFGPKQ